MRRTLRLILLAAVTSAAGITGGCADDGGGPAAPRPPGPTQPTDQVWGALGDSQTDEYQADDHRGPETVLNWLEILVRLRDLHVGEWSGSGRGEPRRRGYAHNWARSGAVMSGVLSQQLDGLVREIEAGRVTHAVLFSTGNEWVNQSPRLMLSIYNSPDGGVHDATGRTIDARVQEVSGQIVEVMEALSEAVLRVEGGSGGVVVLTPLDYVLHPGVAAALPDPVRRDYVSMAVARIHTIVAARAEEINAAAGRTVVSVAYTDEHLRAVWRTADGRYVTAAGVRLDYTRDTSNGSPYHLALAPTTGSAHMGTVGNGVFARTFIAAANRLPGVQIDQLSDAEIRAAAGID